MAPSATPLKPQSPRTPRADSAATRERLLASSLRLFSERGYRGTSVRAITDDADVNLAAANYHFGSKQQLLEATFFSALAPINAERLKRLDVLLADASLTGTALAGASSTTGAVDVAQLVRAFVEPVLAPHEQECLPKLLANLFAESKEVAVPLLESTFGPTFERFLQAFALALPDVDGDDLAWRLHFLIGSMLQLAHFNAPLFTVQTSSTSECQNVVGIDQLVRFVVAGLCQAAGEEAVTNLSPDLEVNVVKRRNKRR